MYVIFELKEQVYKLLYIHIIFTPNIKGYYYSNFNFI